VSDRDRTIAALAREAGVQRSYTDVRGRRRTASTAALRAVLAALGHDAGPDGKGAADALRGLRAARERRLAEPVAVAWCGTASIPVRSGGRVDWTLALEDGGERRGRAADGRSVRLSDVPPGYHTLHLSADGREATQLLLAAPGQAYAAGGRSWGVFLPLYALPGPLGPGDLTGLRRLAAWTAGYGGATVGSTPLFAAFLDRPFDPSPYAPVSRLYWNELYVDPVAVPELEASAEARRLVAAAAPALVDYAAAMAAKRAILEALLQALQGPRLEAFERHLDAHPDLRAYAGFRAQCEREGAGWRGWSGAEAGDSEGAAARYHAYAQWVCADQLARVAESGAGPYLDMPLGVHPSGYDTWRFTRAFAEGASVGAPPDDFFTGGQDWGFPPLHPARIREQGYAYPVACIRELLRHAAAARIDHVMGMHRTFWVPDGFAAADGIYVRYPAAELYAVLCIESHRFATVIVGEDLGTVPDGVRRSMSAHGLLRTFVLQAEAAGDGDPLDHVPSTALVGMNTHDMPTFAGFWEGNGRTDAPRRRLAAAVARRGHPAGDGPSVLGACLDELARSEARCLMINLEDLWWEREPQNVPGTTSERPNWRRRARYGVDELDRVPGLSERLRRIAVLREGAA
jgi:4-alpha-glucanotransferase